MSKIDISRLPHFADTLIGRDAELARLDDAWSDPAQHVLVIRGIGGEGKTSLVAAWTARLAGRNYDGASYFDWSFYSQGTRDQAATSSDSFLATALGFFGGDEGKALANSPASARDKAIKLLGYLRKDRTLLVLDGLEPLQYPPGPLAGQLRDDAMSALLKALAQINPGLCIVTTREPVTDLARFQDNTAPELELERLTDAAGADFLQRLLEPTKPKGVHQVKSTLPEREEISRAVKGHALTLRILGNYIHRALRDVRRWREVDYTQADALYKTNPNDPNARYGHAFTTIEAYDRCLARSGPHSVRRLAVLRLLGLFDRPASGTCLEALLAEPIITGLTEPLVGITEEELNITLSELEECGLVSLPRSELSNFSSRIPSLDAHPLLREYFARQLKTEHPETWRAAHRRIYENLCATTKEGDQPTLEDLQPLYQAVAHGCLAGLQQEVRVKVCCDRILRGTSDNGYYSTHKLGAFGSDLEALACFFESRWSCISTAFTEAERAWLLNQTAICLRALVRLSEAIYPMRAGLEMVVKHKEWKDAAVYARDLIELELTLGEVSKAVKEAKRSVTYANRSADKVQRMLNHSIYAAAMHLAGHQAEARTYFSKAERMQTNCDSDHEQLFSLRGFMYCDLLLSASERAAWQVVCGEAPPPPEATTHNEMLQSVSQRASRTLEWARQVLSPFDIALDHLTLGRVALYETILDRKALDPCRVSLEYAMHDLRSANDRPYLPFGLLTRAWLRSLTGERTGSESAQSDLDEAWDIAERGPMPLFLADVHMYRARLFFHEKPYPWAKNPDGTPRGPKDDLSAARRIIEKCGYWRRKEELEDAEKAAKNWPDSSPGAVQLAQCTHTTVGKVPAMIKTVLELDLVGYSTIAATLEAGLGVVTAPQLNQQIQEFINAGLQAVKLPRDQTVMKTTGDGAILVFDKPSQAHDFADAVQQATRTHNSTKPLGIGKRVFRMGIATGDLVKEDKPGGGFDSAGMTIARAVRLESKAKPGEVLCDPETFVNLTTKQQRLYSAGETITGKRDEKFQAHRCTLNPDGVADAAFFAEQSSPPTPASPPPKPSPTAPTAEVDRAEILSLFQRLKPHQFDELVFLLGVPIHRRPAGTLDLANRKNELFKWADETPSDLENLLLRLRELVGSGGGSHPK